MERASRGLSLAVAAVYAFLLLPLLIVVAAAFNAGNYFTFPPQGFSLKWFANFFQRREFMQALWLSVHLGFWTAVISTVAGTMASLVLVRGRFRGRDLLNAYVTSPLLLPQILTGVALLQYLSLLGLAQSYWALLIGHVVKPGVVAGAVLAFAISFDNFTISLFLTSPRLTPLPIELFAYLKYSFDPTAAAASAVAISVTLVLMLLIAHFMGLEEFTGF